RPFELLQGQAGLDAEAPDQRPPSRLVGRKRLRLPSRAVEREHQLAAEPFPQRVLGDQAFELSDEFGVAAVLELEDDPALEGGQAKLLQARRLRLCEGL